MSAYKNNTWVLSSVGRAPALHAGGHRFEPVSLHWIRNGSMVSTLKTEYNPSKNRDNQRNRLRRSDREERKDFKVRSRRKGRTVNA